MACVGFLLYFAVCSLSLTQSLWQLHVLPSTEQEMVNTSIYGRARGGGITMKIFLHSWKIGIRIVLKMKAFVLVYLEGESKAVLACVMELCQLLKTASFSISQCISDSNSHGACAL